MSNQANTTDTNQASEDELRTAVSDMLTNLMIKSSLQKLDKHTDLITSGKKYIAMHNEELNTILALIRTEKLKLLAEVRERAEMVVGNVFDPSGEYVSVSEIDKLEAEL